jgi:hypothetical protein
MQLLTKKQVANLPACSRRMVERLVASGTLTAVIIRAAVSVGADGIAAKKQKAQRGQPQAKEFNHGFHGFHGLKMVSDQTSLVREIRAIRGKIFAKRGDPDILQSRAGAVGRGWAPRG